MNNLHVKTGDNVMIISGKDKGKIGKVLQTSPKEGKVIVEGLNMVTKHVKPRRQGEQGARTSWTFLTFPWWAWMTGQRPIPLWTTSSGKGTARLPFWAVR